MKMKEIRDELIKDNRVKDVKVNYNTDGRNFLLIQHETDTENLLTAVLTKWGSKYEVVSANADEIVFKEK